MRKKVPAFALLSSSLLLAACGEKELSREEVVDNIEEHRDDVDSYETSAVFDVKINQAGMEEESQATMDLVVLESDNQLEVNISETDDLGNKEEEFHYVTEDTIYSSIDGNTWEQMPKADDYTVEDSVSISYGQLFDVFEKIEEELEFEEQDDYYLFTFDEANAEIFDALEEPYNAYINGIPEEDIIHNLELKVDKDDFYFMSFEDKIVGEDGDNKVNLDISHTFSNINEIDELDIPEEVYN